MSFIVSVFAQTDIATARAQGIGATVTITGVVTNGDELGPIRYIEDATAGMAIYDPGAMGAVVRGDEVTVTSGDQGVRFLLISGAPLREPIAWHGPIVMNTQAELRTAMRELNNGTFIKAGAAGW